MLRVIWGCAWKDIRSALTERSTLIQSVSLPVNYLIMMSLFVLAGSHAPTAVVMYDHGPYARQFVTEMRQAASFRLEVTIVASEQDAYRHDTGYIPFLAISIIVIALMVSGLLQAGNAASREWENSTIKEVLLAPARSWEVLTGRMLGAFVVALPAAAVVLGVVIFLVGDHP